MNQTPIRQCHICKSDHIEEVIQLGEKTICNRFLTKPCDHEYTHPFLIEKCCECGLLQVGYPIPATELTPVFDWITYSEPDAHLNQMLETI